MEMLCAVSHAPRAPVGQQAKASFQPSHPAIFDVMTKIRVSVSAPQIFSLCGAEAQTLTWIPRNTQRCPNVDINQEAFPKITWGSYISAKHPAHVSVMSLSF